MPIDWNEFISKPTSGTTKSNTPGVNWDEYVNPPAPRAGGVTSNQFSASIDQYQAGLYGVGEAVTGAVGANSLSDWAKQKREENEREAERASTRARQLGAVDSWENVHGVGDFGSYAKGLAIQSAPYAIEALTGGLEARALMGGTRAALSEARAALVAGKAAGDATEVARATQAVKQAERSLNTGSLVGGAVQSYPSSVGDILQNQREQTGGKTDLGAAGLLGIPYAALNAVGPEAALSKGTLFRNTVNFLDRPGGIAGGLARAGATAVGEGVKEGLSETGQEMLNQAGRMAVDDKAQFFSQEAQNRYKESFIGGATLGGLMGGALGGYRRSEGYQAGNDVQQAFTQPQTSGTPITGQTPPAPPGTTVTAPPAPPNMPPGQTGAPITPPSAPAVVGGTTAVAQGAQAQTQAQFAAQQQQQIQEQREKVIDQFGLRGEKEGVGQFFNRPIFGPAINQVADALAPIAAKLDQQEATVMDAIVQADKATGGKLVNFKFNGDKIPQSVQKGVEAVLAVANKFQIGHVGSSEEAAQILNTLSKSAKGAELEQINAIHQVLTGKDTEGYVTAQAPKPTKGKSNAQQQPKTTAGLGTVPEQGGAGQVDSGLTGLLQPGAVQPIGAGSIAGATTNQQAGQPSGEGIRPSASIAADNGSPVLTPQVTGVPSETGTTTQIATDQGIAAAPTSTDVAGQPGVSTVDSGTNGVQASAEQYNPRLQYYATDLNHISSERRDAIRDALLKRAISGVKATEDGDTGENLITFEERLRAVEAILLEGKTRAEVEKAVNAERARLGKPALAVGSLSRSLLRLGISEKPALSPAQKEAKASLEADLGISPEVAAEIDALPETAKRKLNKVKERQLVSAAEETKKAKEKENLAQIQEKTKAERKGLEVGDTVVNPKLGTGVVKSFAGNDAETRVTIDFQNGTTKELLVSVAKLEKTKSAPKAARNKETTFDDTSEELEVETTIYPRREARIKAANPALPADVIAKGVDRLEKLEAAVGTELSALPFSTRLLDVALSATEFPEFPSGITAQDFGYLYKRTERKVLTRKTIEDEQGSNDQDFDKTIPLAEELYGGESGEGKSMGFINSAGGSQGAVDSSKSKALTKAEDLQAMLAATPDTDVEGKANIAKQLVAAWKLYEKEQKTRGATGEVTTTYKEEKATELGKTETETEGEEDAVQVESADEGDVQEPAGGGEEVGKANAEPKKPARARKAKAESKPAEEAKPEIKTAEEQWTALADQFPQMPPYATLNKDEKIRWDDVAERGVANLAAANTILSTVVKAAPAEKVEAPAAAGTTEAVEQPKFGVTRAVKNPYTAAELTADIKNFIRADILGNKLIIVDSVSDLIRHPDADLRAVGKAVGDKGAYGVAANGKAYLIANRIEQGQGRAKFMHEVGAHLGLENLLPKVVYDKLASQIDTWAKADNGSVESKLAKAAQARVEAAQTSEEDRQSEMLAYFIEEAVQSGIDPTMAGKESTKLAAWFRTMWNAIKATLRSLGFKTEVVTAQDIVDLAFGAAQLELSSKTATGQERAKFGFAGIKGVQTRGMTDKQVSNLTTAKLMDANGELRSDIWYDTGWLRGVDNQWRTEFSDKDASLKAPLSNFGTGKLGDLLDHPILYKLYPQLTGYTLVVDPQMEPNSAAFIPEQQEIRMAAVQNSPVTALLHEVQHAIQEIEGFGKGANPAEMDMFNVNAANKFAAASHVFGYVSPETQEAIAKYRDAIEAKHLAVVARDTGDFKTVAEERAAVQRTMDTDKAARRALGEMLSVLGSTEGEFKERLYRMVSGEIEARDVEARRQYSDALRRQVVPGEAEGFTPETQLVYDKASNSYMKFGVDGKTADQHAREQISKLPPKWQPAARTVTTTLMHTLQKAGLASMITEDVINAATKYMKSAQNYLTAQYARQTTRLAHELKIEKILQQHDKLPENLKGIGKGSVNEYIHDSTREGLWGYYPDARMVGTTMAKIDPGFKARFDAFGKDSAAQKLIKAVFEQGHDSLVAKQKAVTDAINREYADRAADALGDADLTAKLNKEKNLRIARESKLMGLDGSKPYAYMGRYGDYVVVAKSAEYKEKEKLSESRDIAAAEKEVYKIWMKDNQSNPAHYVVQFAETLGEADQIAEKLDATGNYDIAESFEKEAYDREGGEMFAAVARLRNLHERESKGDNPAAAKAIRNLLGDLYLHTVSEASARKSEFQRLNISGADKDMMRNLATRGRADAHFLAALQHNDAIFDSITDMREERDRNRREAGPYFNELLKRHANSMKYETPSVLASALQRISTVWYLSTNPAFYLQQILQTGTISLPYMAGRLGYFRSARAIKLAYSDMATLVKGLGISEHVDFENAPADVRAMLKTLVGMGKIDIGIDSDSTARAGDTGVTAAVMQKLQGVNNRIETINRATAAIAAYRGYLERYKNNDTAAATKYAAEVVSNTHGSYDAFNTPRIMATGAGKVLLQFKRFQIIQISMLAKLLTTAFKGASAEEKTVARHSLAFIVGQMGVLGGLMAVPFAQQAASILSKIFGDPDEPDDWEFKLRRMIGDKAVADLLISGVPGAMGLDVSGKIGMGNVFSILPFTNIDFASRSGAEKMLVGLMGPSASLGLKFADGLGMMSQGDYYKGLEQMLPNGVASVMKAGRFASEGITMRNGDVVLKPEEISMLDAAFQAVGLPTNTITDRQFTQKVVKEFDQYYKQRDTEIKGDYVEASRKGDSAAMGDARDEWNKLQDSRVVNGYKRQPFSDLYKAPMAANKRERNIAGGVEFGKSNRRFVESLSTI